MPRFGEEISLPKEKFSGQRYRKKQCIVQPCYPNSVVSKSLLFRTNARSPWFCLTFLRHFSLFICNSVTLFRIPRIFEVISVSFELHSTPLFQSIITKMTDKHPIGVRRQCDNRFYLFVTVQGI